MMIRSETGGYVNLENIVAIDVERCGDEDYRIKIWAPKVTLTFGKFKSIAAAKVIFDKIFEAGRKGVEWLDPFQEED